MKKSRFTLLPVLLTSLTITAFGSPHARRAATVSAAATAQAQQPSNPLKDPHAAAVTSELGLTAIESGSFTREEDERIFADIRNANDIKLLMPNGSRLIDLFRKQFTDYLAKPQSTMEVLFATSKSTFYQEETAMTSLGLNPENGRTNENLVALGRGRLEGYAGSNKEHLHFRYFDTQYRLSMIIINNRTCYLTIRLSPNEPSQSFRMEFQDGFAASCVAHFNKMWNVSSDLPEKGGILAFLGLANDTTRTEWIAFIACLGTLLAGLSSLMAILGIPKPFGKEKNVATTGVKVPQSASQDSAIGSPSLHQQQQRSEFFEGTQPRDPIISTPSEEATAIENAPGGPGASPAQP